MHGPKMVSAQRVHRVLIASCVAFTLCAAPAWARYSPDDRAQYEREVFYAPYSGTLTALQTFRSVDLTTDDIATALPLVREIRNCDRALWADTSLVESDLMYRRNSRPPKVDADTAVDRAIKRCDERKERAWNKITEKIGSTKCAALRNLIEPQKHEEQYEASAGIKRIDSLIAQWDTQTKQRLAATHPDQTSSETVLATTVTVTPAPAPVPIVYYTPAPLTAEQLADIMQDRLVFMIASPKGERMYMYSNRDIDVTDLWDFWHQKAHTWD